MNVVEKEFYLWFFFWILFLGIFFKNFSRSNYIYLVFLENNCFKDIS